MTYELTTTVEPAEEPVTADEAKANCRVTHAAEDSQFTRWVKAATKYAEGHTNRRFVTQSVRLVVDDFPCGSSREPIEIPVAPVASVSSVTYVNVSGVTTALVANTDYLAWLGHSPPLVYPAPGKVWPTTQAERRGRVSVTFVAGYGARSAVPDPIKAAIEMTVTYWYENRGDAKDPTELGLPAGARRLLDLFMTGRY